MIVLATITVFLPLVAAIIAGLGQPWVGHRGAQIVTSSAMVLAAMLAWVVFLNIGFGSTPDQGWSYSWFTVGKLEASWGVWIDTLSAVMLVVVTTVSAIVHIYSIGYMADDPSIARFHAYLSLFTFAMLMLVTADNLLQMFFGWEGVGLCSYLLIGFWYHKESANIAAIKAFVVNRVGDFGFALGIFGLFWLTGTVDFQHVFAAASDSAIQEARWSFLGMDFNAITLLTMLLFIGAMGKSAQLFMHTWLPDAMEGPTPVSALIHAATMVTAGVFMVARLSPLFELAPATMVFITFIGASTAFFAATVGLTQFDIKRVIAYSTCSQLGYMFFALGVGAYGTAVFHLFTHAFFKALLFLGAGAVIHAMHHEQDMRKMGGLASKLPWTHGYMLIGSLALAGIGIPQLFGGIGLAGFHSKDMIIEEAWLAHTPIGNYAFWLGIVVAFMTAFYSFRLMFLTFYGQPRGDAHTHEHAHEAPGIMRWPLMVLLVGAVISGYLLKPHFALHSETANQFWAGAVADFPALTDDYSASHSEAGYDEHAVAKDDNHSGDSGDNSNENDYHDAEHDKHPPIWVLWLPLIVALSGIVMAWLVYGGNRNWGVRIAHTFAPLNTFFANKWYFDEAYDILFVRPARGLGHFFWKKGDDLVIDGYGPNGLRDLARWGSLRLRQIQTGYIYHYAFAMILGVVVLMILLWFMLARG